MKLPLAVVNQNFSTTFERFFEWAGTDTKKFQGHFITVEDAIKDIPQKYQIIKVDITDTNGKPVNYIVNRDAPTEQ